MDHRRNAASILDALLWWLLRSVPPQLGWILLWWLYPRQDGPHKLVTAEDLAGAWVFRSAAAVLPAAKSRRDAAQRFCWE